MKVFLALLLSCSIGWAYIEDNSIRPWNGDYSADPAPCCLPKRWRGIVGDLVGFKSGHRSGAARAMAEVYVDMDVGKAASMETVLLGGKPINVTTVADYNKKIMYVVTSRRPNKCYKLRLPKSKKTQCLPKQAKFVGSASIGWGASALKVNEYHFKVNTKKIDAFVEITVTSTGCGPVSEAGMIHTRRSAKMFTVGFFDLKPDIPDPKVFDPPKVCRNATDTEVELTDLQDYLFNVKFTL